MRKLLLYGFILLAVLTSCNLNKRTLKKAEKKFNAGEYELSIEHQRGTFSVQEKGEASISINL